MAVVGAVGAIGAAAAAYWCYRRRRRRQALQRFSSTEPPDNKFDGIPAAKEAADKAVVPYVVKNSPAPAPGSGRGGEPRVNLKTLRPQVVAVSPTAVVNPESAGPAPSQSTKLEAMPESRLTRAMEGAGALASDVAGPAERANARTPQRAPLPPAAPTRVKAAAAPASGDASSTAAAPSATSGAVTTVAAEQVAITIAAAAPDAAISAVPAASLVAATPAVQAGEPAGAAPAFRIKRRQLAAPSAAPAVVPVQRPVAPPGAAPAVVPVQRPVAPPGAAPAEVPVQRPVAMAAPVRPPAVATCSAPEVESTLRRPSMQPVDELQPQDESLQPSDDVGRKAPEPFKSRNLSELGTSVSPLSLGGVAPPAQPLSPLKMVSAGGGVAPGELKRKSPKERIAGDLQRRMSREGSLSFRTPLSSPSKRSKSPMPDGARSATASKTISRIRKAASTNEGVSTSEQIRLQGATRRAKVMVTKPPEVEDEVSPKESMDRLSHHNKLLATVAQMQSETDADIEARERAIEKETFEAAVYYPTHARARTPERPAR